MFCDGCKPQWGINISNPKLGDSTVRAESVEYKKELRSLDSVILRQMWHYEKGWRIKRLNNEVYLPAGKTLFVSPKSTNNLILPWKVLGRKFSLFCCVNEPGLLSTYCFLPESGNVKISFFNSTDHVITLAARTFLVHIVAFVPLHVQKLESKPKEKSRQIMTSGIDIFNVVSVTEWEEISKPECWAREYPSVFDEVVRFNNNRRKLMVRSEHLKVNGDPVTDFGSNFVYDFLVDKRKIEGLAKEYERRQYIEHVSIDEWVYVSPALFLPKKGNKVRWVNDYRRLNGYFSMPSNDLISVNEVIRNVKREWRYFCVIDLQDGFFSLPLARDITKWFGFQLGNQRYKWKVLPQGFKLSAAIFHRTMGWLLADLDMVHYVDDILTGGKDVTELVENVSKVLRRLEDFNLKVQQTKIRFGKEKIQFLGWDIFAGGKVSCESYLAEKNGELFTVKNLNDLQKVLGVFNVVRKFVPDFSAIVKPLINFTKGNTHFEVNRVNILLKNAWSNILSVQQVLQLPPHDKVEWELYSDWSEGCFGYLLFYVIEGMYHLVDIESKKDKGLKNVSSFLGELRAIHFALKQTRRYFHGKKISVFCDNKGVVQRLNNFTDDFTDVRVSRIYGWLMENFQDISFCFYPGSLNVLADLCSRLKEGGQTEIQEISVITSSRLTHLYLAHDGHWNFETTYRHLKMMGHSWPDMKNDCLQFVKQCPSCQRYGPLHRTPPWGHLMGVCPFDLLFIDFAGPWRWGSNQEIHVAVLIDSFSKFMFARAYAHADSFAAADLVSEFLKEHPRPRRIQSDNAQAFVSLHYRDYLHEIGVEARYGPANSPRSQGVVERSIGTLLGRIRRNGNSGNWNIMLQSAIFQMNDAVHKSTGVTPNSIRYGRLRNGMVLDEQQFQLLVSKVREHLHKVFLQGQKRHLKRFPQNKPLQQGEKVFLYNFRNPGKFNPHWLGPFWITEKKSNHLFMLKGEGERSRTMGPFHAHQLKRAF